MGCIRTKRGVMLVWLFMLSFAFMTSCSQNTNYVTDAPFAIVTSIPAGPDVYQNFFPRNVAIYDNGKLLLYIESKNDLKIGNDAPVYETHLAKKEVEKVKKLIEESNFWQLNEDLTSPSEDGTFLYMTVNLTDQSRKVGGLNPNDPKFIEITEYVMGLISDEDYNAWEEEAKEHVYNMNPD